MNLNGEQVPDATCDVTFAFRTLHGRSLASYSFPDIELWLAPEGTLAVESSEPEATSKPRMTAMFAILPRLGLS